MGSGREKYRGGQGGRDLEGGKEGEIYRGAGRERSRGGQGRRDLEEGREGEI